MNPKNKYGALSLFKVTINNKPNPTAGNKLPEISKPWINQVGKELTKLWIRIRLMLHQEI